MEQKGHFASTLYDALNVGTESFGFGREATYSGTARAFFRGGYEFVYEDDPDVEDIEYFVSSVHPDRLEPWTLPREPVVLLELLSLPTHHEHTHWIKHEAVLGFLEKYGPLTISFLEERDRLGPGEDFSDEYWALESDPRNHRDFKFKFSDPVNYLRSAIKNMPEQGPIPVVELLDRSPTPSLYRALVLQLLEVAISGRGVPRPCAGCGRWFTETDNDSTAVHRAGWKRSDARYHSRSCLKAASERRRRARSRNARTKTSGGRLEGA